MMNTQNQNSTYSLSKVGDDKEPPPTLKRQHNTDKGSIALSVLNHLLGLGYDFEEAYTIASSIPPPKASRGSPSCDLSPAKRHKSEFEHKDVAFKSNTVPRPGAAAHNDPPPPDSKVDTKVCPSQRRYNAEKQLCKMFITNSEIDGIKMAIVPSNFPNKMFTADQLKEVKESLERNILGASERMKPRFAGCSKRIGWMSVNCMDDATVGWLQWRLATIRIWPKPGPGIKAIPEAELPHGQMFSARFPQSVAKSSDEILSTIAKQNFPIFTNRWRVASRHNNKAKFAVMTLFVDRTSVVRLKKKVGLELKYNSHLVQLRPGHTVGSVPEGLGFPMHGYQNTNTGNDHPKKQETSNFSGPPRHDDAKDDELPGTLEDNNSEPPSQWLVNPKFRGSRTDSKVIIKVEKSSPEHTHDEVKVGQHPNDQYDGVTVKSEPYKPYKEEYV